MGVAFPNKGLVADQGWDNFLSACCRGWSVSGSRAQAVTRHAILGWESVV